MQVLYYNAMNAELSVRAEIIVWAWIILDFSTEIVNGDHVCSSGTLQVQVVKELLLVVHLMVLVVPVCDVAEYF
jgi:hypothetical protein